MIRNVLIVITIAFLTVPVYGELSFDANKGIPGNWENRCSTEKIEISHLKALIEAQKKKISLLEAKINVLETQLRNQKGASK